MSDSPLQLTIRPAAPIVDEGCRFAALLDLAQEHVYRKILGRRYDEIVAAVYVESGNELSHEHAWFAESSGKIVGMGAGYTNLTPRSAGDRIAENLTGSTRFRWVAFSRLATRVKDFMHHVPDGDFYIRALAVEPSAQGAGVGTELLGTLEDAARKVGALRLALDVAARNKDAQRLYQREGFSVETESPRWFGMRNTNVLRMVKTL